VVIGAPDHWHKTIALDAVAAGKDVYVEKPVSHTIAEGEEMVKVIEASKQIVQTGTQQRSWDHFVLGKQIIDSGRLGQITFAHTYWYQHADGRQLLARVDGAAGLEEMARPGARSARSSRSASISGVTSGTTAAAASPT
jgi:predicted dehydrogenase